MISVQTSVFSNLTPAFRNLFTTGLPILMYHKVGKRPSEARMKGLYLSNQLFRTQLQDLTKAGFLSAKLEKTTKNVTIPNKQFVITFDDGFRNVLQNAVPIMAEFNCTAIQFLVPKCLGTANTWDEKNGEFQEPIMTPAEVREWLAAGHQIGSHSLTHASLTRLSLRDAREEIFASKKALEDLFQFPIVHFCYPYGDFNQHVSELVREAGYETACTTQPGVNTPSTQVFELKRFTARYPTRSLKSIGQRLAQFKQK